MSVGMQVFWTNVLWALIAFGVVSMAFWKTQSLHSFWFILVYFVGHSRVERVNSDQEGGSDD